jgi:hypothetical protein
LPPIIFVTTTHHPKVAEWLLIFYVMLKTEKPIVENRAVSSIVSTEILQDPLKTSSFLPVNQQLSKHSRNRKQSEPVTWLSKAISQQSTIRPLPKFQAKGENKTDF